MAAPEGAPLDPAFERRVLGVVDAALDAPAAEREAVLRAGCGGDPVLLEAARTLLAACERVEADPRLLDTPAAQVAAPVIRSVEGDLVEGESAVVARLARALAGRYEIGTELGRGGNATVYLARDLPRDRAVAIKVIRPGAADPAQRRRFLDEVRHAAQLRHPFIVPLIDSGEADGILYYVMPFVEGESLAERLAREGPLAWDAALAITRDVAEALGEAHARGIIHRDVKPRNILLSGGHALVADFGIALALEPGEAGRHTERGVAVGTPAYMSPEQASASQHLDGRSDVYALGCVVYEMLTGEAPYGGHTPRAIVAKHLLAPVPDARLLRPGLPREAQAALERALAKVAADRFASPGEFVAALAAVPARAEGPRRARRWPRWAGVALLAGLGLVLARMLAQGTGAPTPAASPPDPRRLAVLYLDNLSDEPEVGLLARGLTEDLIDELSRVRGLRVISPNGVRPFAERPVAVDSIARALAVGTVVGGSVSASPQAVRVTIRLLDPGTGEQLRSQSFEVARAAALALREAVTLQTTTFLRERLGEEIRLRESREETRSLPAWQLVQRGDAVTRDGVEAALAGRGPAATDLLQRADSLYREATRRDPAWLRPVIGRGWAALRLALLAGDAASVPSSPQMDRALRLADEAVRRSNGRAEALALRGYAREWLATWPGAAGAEAMGRQAEADLRAALDQRPEDARSWYALGELLYIQGRATEAAAALREAWDRDAWLVEVRGVVSLLFFTALDLQRFEEAGRWCALGQARYAGDPRFTTCRLILLGWTGRDGRALRDAWQELRAIEAGDSAGMFGSQWTFLRMMPVLVAARAGLGDSARRMLARVTDEGTARGRPPARIEEAYARLLLGERAEALRLLGAELQADPGAGPALLRRPWFQPLVTDSSLPRILGR